VADFRELFQAEQAKVDEEVTSREQRRREAQEILDDFVALMIEHEVGKLAVYRETEHAVFRDEGIFRPKLVSTGGVRSTYELMGRGWCTGVNDGSDYDLRNIAVLDNGDTYWAGYRGYRVDSDHPSPPYLAAKEDAQKCQESPFDIPSWQRALASTALDLIRRNQSG
jgi:hypothetical protein